MPQIIHLPPVRPQKQKGVDPKMRDRVLEFLDRFPDSLPDDFLDRIANDVMLDRFGYTPAEGKPLAVRVLQALEQEGKVRIRYDEHPTKKKVAPAVAEVRRIVPEPAAVSLPAPPQETTRPDQARSSRTRRHTPAKPAPENRQWNRWKKSSLRNEARGHRLMVRLVQLLIAIPAARIIQGVAKRSENRDARDRHGDDEQLRLTAVTRQRVKLIYDYKSDPEHVAKYNADIRYAAGQSDAHLKRAILLNPGRADRDFIGEVLDDLHVVGLGIDTDTRQAILDHFSD